MKKLVYSVFSLAIIASSVLVGCKGTDDGGGDTPKSSPKIAFQTNTGTFSGYTFTDGSVQVGTTIKIGAIITSDINLKSTHMTVKYQNGNDSMIGTDTIISSKTCNRDYYFKIPSDKKGKYVFTIHATDKDATTSKASITITAFGPLTERGAGGFRVYSLKATTSNHYSAFDLNLGEEITASSSAGNEAQRDIEDMSTTTTLSKSWRSRNGAEFLLSDLNGKINGKVYDQFQSEDDLKAAWNAAGTKSTSVTGIDIGMMLIVKSNNGGSDIYYLIGIDDVHEEAIGGDDDYIEFHYKN